MTQVRRGGNLPQVGIFCSPTPGKINMDQSETITRGNRANRTLLGFGERECSRERWHGGSKTGSLHTGVGRTQGGFGTVYFVILTFDLVLVEGSAIYATIPFLGCDQSIQPECLGKS